jgi:hypothetical protein
LTLISIQVDLNFKYGENLVTHEGIIYLCLWY